MGYTGALQAIHGKFPAPGRTTMRLAFFYFGQVFTLEQLFYFKIFTQQSLNTMIIFDYSVILCSKLLIGLIGSGIKIKDFSRHFSK